MRKRGRRGFRARRIWGLGGMAVAGVVAASPLSASAQLLRPTEASDRVFEGLELARAFGLLDTIPMGQRIGLERALRRALRDGAAPLPEGLAELERYLYAPDLMGSLEVSYGWADVSPRRVPDNGLGGIDAIIAPLVQHRGGRVLDDGSNWTVEPAFRARSGEWSFHFRSRLRWTGGGDTELAEGRVQDLWAEGPVGPLYVSVGRAPIAWGTSPFGGSMLSGQARAMDQVTVASDGTFRFPWIFRHLGPARLSLSVARLEGSRDIPHSFLVAYKLSYKPARSVEFGVSVLNHSGGEGAPSASFGRRLLDFTVLGERFTDDLDSEISNLLTGFDIRWQIPGLRGTQVYTMITLDDFGSNSELGRVFGQDAAYIGGLAVPRLARDGSVGLRIEYRKTGIRFYEHGQFTSGLTFDDVVLGDPLGPNGRGGRVAVDVRPGGADHLTFQAVREERSADVYRSQRIDGDLEFFKTSDLTEEIRTRLEVTWERNWPGRPFGTLARAGYEHVSNFGFEAGRARDGAVLELRVTVGFSSRR